MEAFHCEKCGGDVETRVVEREEEFPVRGEATKVCSHVRVCRRCGKSIYDKELDSATIQAAYDIYRQRHNILAPAEIRAFRSQYGLSQRNLAALLGFGEITIHRYENGSLPDEAHNRLLRSIHERKNMAQVFKDNQDRLPQRVRQGLAKKLKVLLAEGKPTHTPKSSRSTTSRHRPSIFTGYRLFSADALKAMMMFFVSQPGGVLKTKLNKLLWYADFLHYRLHSVSISGAKYIHLPFGPVPSNYDRHLTSLITEKAVVPEEIEFPGEMTGENLTSEQAPDFDCLSDTASPVLAAVWKQFDDLGSKRISDLSHEEEGYKSTEEGEAISYEYADQLKVDIPVDGIE